MMADCKIWVSMDTESYLGQPFVLDEDAGHVSRYHVFIGLFTACAYPFHRGKAG